jgi:hypothetical protein
MPIVASCVRMFPVTSSPGVISDLYLVSSGGGDATVGTNNMPGQVGYGGGDATSYELRGGVTPITTEAHWAVAPYRYGPHSAAGFTPASTQSFFALAGGSLGLYLSVKVFNSDGASGGISNAVLAP